MLYCGGITFCRVALSLLRCVVKVGEVIAKSDYILVAAALTPSTLGMVGAAELARVGPICVGGGYGKIYCALCITTRRSFRVVS